MDHITTDFFIGQEEIQFFTVFFYIFSLHLLGLINFETARDGLVDMLVIILS
jgi:hypothetical protein